MKRIATRFAFLVAVSLISAMPALAGEMGTGGGGQKDECLLVAQTCRTSVDTIQQRIERLNKEISKGERVYSREELRHLEFQLKDATRNLDVLISEGGV